MSEITKLYENAGIKKEVIKGCYDYYSKLGIDIWKENDCAGKNCDTCKKDKSIKRYPPFTAEKQIEIVKFLLAKDIFKCYQHYTSKAYIVLTDDVKDFICNKPFNEFLASYINYIWQSLSEEEKQQVKGILE